MLLSLLAQTTIAITALDAPYQPLSPELREEGCDPEVVHRSEYEFDNGADGSIDFTSHRTFRYDPRGNEVVATDESPTYAERVERRFDEVNREILVVTTEDVLNDGTVDYTDVKETTYDANGRRLTERIETVSNTSESLIDITYVWAPDGSSVQAIATLDNGRDGSIDQIFTQDASYNAQGAPLSETVEADTDADGEVDGITQNTYSYDSNGNLLVETRTEDPDNDGMANYVSQHVLTYDGQGRLIASNEQEDNDGDGTFDFARTNDFVYDANGNQISSIFSEDADNDGTPERINTRITTYDANGNPILSDQGNDNDGDGTADTRQTIASTYDSQGVLTTQVEEDFAVGVPLSGTRRTRTYTYSLAGTQVLVREEVDDQRDGTVDSLTLRRQLVEDLRVNSTRWHQETVAATDLGGSEATLAGLLTNAVTALELGGVSTALRNLIAFDVATATLEGAGTITAEQSAELRAPVPSLVDLYVKNCSGLGR